MCQRIKAILFDHDGTLVDSEKIHYNLWAAILKSYNITFTIEEYIRYYAGIPTPSNADRMVDTYSLEISPAALIQEKSNLTSAYLSSGGFPLMPGAKESLAHFHKIGIKMAVVTGAGIEGVKVTVKNNNLQGYFSALVSGDEVERSKPAPDPYLLAIKKLGLDSSECIAIEDTYNGILSAASANIGCVGISSTMSKHQDLSKAIRIFNDLNKATKWITANYKLGPL